MIIQYYGHSFFSLTLETGSTIVFDPYGEFYQYPKRNIIADVCLVSHHHHDHDGVTSLDGKYILIDEPGMYRPLPQVTITGTQTCHDEKNGSLRGMNTVYSVEAEGLNIVHCGDLGHIPTQSQLVDIGQPDVLLVPIGGYYTIDSNQAIQLKNLLSPIVTIPMHYKTQFDPEMPIQDLSEFLSVTHATNTQYPLLRITRQDISERPQVITLKIL